MQLGRSKTDNDWHGLIKNFHNLHNVSYELVSLSPKTIMTTFSVTISAITAYWIDMVSAAL
jgi:hypothetical protein